MTKRFGSVTALDGVSFVAPTGSCTALVGESGSGKTTLLRTFNRMVDPDRGSALVSREDVALLEPVPLRRSIGYVEQEGGLLPHWTVERNVGLVPWLRRIPDVRSTVQTALDLVGLPLEPFGARGPRELSGGQRQRVALARALAGSPAVLLLDEPFGALDAITRVDVQSTFGELQRRLGLTTLLVTHDLRVAFELADLVVVMRAGHVDQAGEPTVLRESPATPYVRALLEKAGVA